MGNRVGSRLGRRLLPLAAAALLTTSGCWLQSDANGGRTREVVGESTLTPATVAGLHEVWSASIPSQVSEPMVKDGRVFMASTSSDLTSATVLAQDLATGARSWTTTLQSVPPGLGAQVVGSGVTYLDDQLQSGYVGYAPITPGGPFCGTTTVRLNPATGAASTSSGVMTWGRVGNGDIRATVESSCPSPLSTTLRVSSPSGSWQPAGTVGPSGRIVISGNQVFLAGNDIIDAYAASGCGAASCSPTWSLSLPNGVASLIAGATGPLFATSGSELVAIDRQGFVAWRAPLAGPAGLAMTNAGTVYATVRSTTGSPELAAFDANGCGQAQCGPLWTAPLPGTGGGAPAVAGGVVYAKTSTGVHALDGAGCGAATCAPLVSVPTGAAAYLVVSDGHVLVAGNGQLTALGL